MTRKDINMVAELVAERVEKKVSELLAGARSEQDCELVDTREAARVIGVSPAHMRRIREKFPHVKVGNTNQGRLLFRRKDLLKSYENYGSYQNP